MRAIAIDFETANEQRWSPCAVGLAWIEDGAVTRRAYRLIRPPEMRFAPGNIRVHGIHPVDVEREPDFPAVMDEFWPDLTGTLILAHNAPFDIGVICATLARYGRAVPDLAYLCTRDIARRAWPAEPSFGLAAMAARIGLTFQHHHAEHDAYACARVALAAALDHGTDRISVLADRLALPRRSSAGWMRPVETPRRPAPPPRPGRDPLVFAVAGSSGARYEVRGAFAGAGFRLRCDCMAGRFGSRCKHVTALLDGDVTNLASENHYDVEKLRVIVEVLGLDAVLPPERARRAA